MTAAEIAQATVPDTRVVISIISGHNKFIVTTTPDHSLGFMSGMNVYTTVDEARDAANSFWETVVAARKIRDAAGAVR